MKLYKFCYFHIESNKKPNFTQTCNVSIIPKILINIKKLRLTIYCHCIPQIVAENLKLGFKNGSTGFKRVHNNSFPKKV